MIVRIVCPRCALRYAGVVRPDCEACRGFGFLGARVPPGTSPWVAARAVTLDGVKREAKIAAGLLCEQAHASSGLADDEPATMQERSAIGQAAGRLLVSLKVRKVRPRKPAVRRSKQAAEAEAIWKQKAAAFQAERERAEKAARAADAVLEDYRVLHADEFEERMETAMAMVALGDLPKTGGRRGWCAGA